MVLTLNDNVTQICDTDLHIQTFTSKQRAVNSWSAFRFTQIINSVVNIYLRQLKKTNVAIINECLI